MPTYFIGKTSIYIFSVMQAEYYKQDNRIVMYLLSSGIVSKILKPQILDFIET